MDNGFIILGGLVAGVAGLLIVAKGAFEWLLSDHKQGVAELRAAVNEYEDRMKQQNKRIDDLDRQLHETIKELSEARAQMVKIQEATIAAQQSAMDHRVAREVVESQLEQEKQRVVSLTIERDNLRDRVRILEHMSSLSVVPNNSVTFSPEEKKA